MTDEEENKYTPQWPSQANIVSFLPSRLCLGFGRLLLTGCGIQLQAIDNFVRGALPGDSFVFFCEFRHHPVRRR
jgi:hypothetical protein